MGRYKKKFSKTTYNNKKQSKQIALNTRAIKAIKNSFERKQIVDYQIWGPSVVGFHHNALNTILQGTADDTRIGDEIKLKYLTLSLGMVVTGGSNTHFRHLVIMDRQNNNSTIAVSPLILFTQAATTKEMLISTYNDEHVGKGKRFQILWDSKAVQIVSGSGRASRQYNVNRKLQHKVHYAGNLGTGADIIDNCLFLYSIFDDANQSWGYSTKVLFTDC